MSCNGLGMYNVVNVKFQKLGRRFQIPLHRLAKDLMSCTIWFRLIPQFLAIKTGSDLQVLGLTAVLKKSVFTGSDDNTNPTALIHSTIFARMLVL